MPAYIQRAVRERVGRAVFTDATRLMCVYPKQQKARKELPREPMLSQSVFPTSSLGLCSDNALDHDRPQAPTLCTRPTARTPPRRASAARPPDPLATDACWSRPGN
ncbi:hypothetical protein ACJQWK_01274 [Exserohilum turcicum]